MGTLHEALWTFLIISRWILRGLKSVSEKSFRENQNTFLRSKTFFPKSSPLCDNVGNMAEPQMAQVTT
jgi:hypothetical protein